MHLPLPGSMNFDAVTNELNIDIAIKRMGVKIYILNEAW